MTPEGRAKHSERLKKLWQEPQYRARQAEALSKRPRPPVSLLPPPNSPEFRQYRNMRDKFGAHIARQMFNIPPPKKARAERPSVQTRRVESQLRTTGSFTGGEAREASPPIHGMTAEMAERRRRFLERHG